MSQWPYAHGGPPLCGRLRSVPEDFVVDEVQDIEPDGEGEHLWLRVRKCGTNTDWLSRELAKFCGVKPMDVSYAGLKDRDAVTTQVFTVHLPGQAGPDWSDFQCEGVEVLERSRHRRKLKRGALSGNRFTLVLRDVDGDREQAELCLQAIATQGVPNYFGEQRFGSGGGNVGRAQAMFAGRRVDRHTRSMLLSAARSHLFNAVLAERVARASWNRALAGEVWSLNGSRSWFGPEPWSEALAERLQRHDIHPSGVLWGRGALPTAEEAGALEQRVVAVYPDLTRGLEQAGLEQDRRPLRLIPQELTWCWLDASVLQLRFGLPPGSYATVVLRELAQGEAQ